MMEFLLLLLQKNLLLLVLIPTCLVVEFLTLCSVFSIKSVSQGIKLFLAVLIGNIILVFSLPFLIWTCFGVLLFVIPMRILDPAMLFYIFVSIGIITLAKSGIIAWTMKKTFNQFVGWLFIINSVSFAIGITSMISLLSVSPESLGLILRVTLSTGLIAMTIKLSIITVGLRKIMSMRTVFIILLMSFVSLLFRNFLLRGSMLFILPKIVLPLVIYPLVEGVVGWIFLKGRLSFRKFRELIPLLVVASVGGKIGAVIYFYVLKTFFL